MEFVYSGFCYGSSTVSLTGGVNLDVGCAGAVASYLHMPSNSAVFSKLRPGSCMRSVAVALAEVEL